MILESRKKKLHKSKQYKKIQKYKIKQIEDLVVGDHICEIDHEVNGSGGAANGGAPQSYAGVTRNQDRELLQLKVVYI